MRSFVLGSDVVDIPGGETPEAILAEFQREVRSIFLLALTTDVHL